MATQGFNLSAIASVLSELERLFHLRRSKKKHFPDAKHVSALLLTAFDKGVDVSGYNKSACATKK